MQIANWATQYDEHCILACAKWRTILYLVADKFNVYSLIQALQLKQIYSSYKYYKFWTLSAIYFCDFVKKN